MYGIAALVERRQVTRRGVYQRRIGGNPSRRTIPTGAGTRMLPEPPRQRIEHQPDRIAESPVQPFVAVLDQV